MTIDFNRATEVAQRLQNQARGIDDMVAALSQIRDLDNYRSELERRTKALQSEVDAQLAKVSDAKALVASAQVEAQKIVASAAEGAIQVATKADLDAEGCIARAKGAAADIKAQASAAAERTRADARAILEAAQKDAAAEKDAAAASRKQLDAIRAEVAELEDRREKARSALQALLNA